MALIRVTANHFCAGVVTRHWIVKRTAPILKYMLGWTMSEVKIYCRKKNWTFKVVPTGKE